MENVEKVKTMDYLRQEGEKFERTTCKCNEKVTKKFSDVAKHYLYHRPNPKMKWPVQSIKFEEQRLLKRKNTIITKVSPHKLISTNSSRMSSSLLDIAKSIVSFSDASPRQKSDERPQP